MLAEDAEWDENVIAKRARNRIHSPKQQQMARGQNPYSSVNLERIESWKNNKALPKWEILVMIVEPELQGHGIAGQFMGMTVEEIKRRCVTQIRRERKVGRSC